MRAVPGLGTGGGLGQAQEFGGLPGEGKNLPGGGVDIADGKDEGVLLVDELPFDCQAGERGDYGNDAMGHGFTGGDGHAFICGEMDEQVGPGIDVAVESVMIEPAVKGDLAAFDPGGEFAGEAGALGAVADEIEVETEG